MKTFISYSILRLIKRFSKTFYRFKIGWPEERIRWNDVRLIIFINHTSLYEFLFLGFLPTHFLRRLSKRMVIPGADKTLNRPVVGTFFKLFSPGIISISRKRDNTWDEFLNSIYDDAIIAIVPEGRMMRRSGLDVDGNKMTVRGGVGDILKRMDKGQMIIAYSGGLHHVQVPGERWFPKLFKTLKLDLEVFETSDFKTSFIEPSDSDEWKKAVIGWLQHGLETKCPT